MLCVSQINRQEFSSRNVQELYDYVDVLNINSRLDGLLFNISATIWYSNGLYLFEIIFNQ